MHMNNESNTNMSAIDVTQLSFSYRNNPQIKAIENLDLQIPQGQFVMIMGPSEAGKSTLANCLNGLIPHFIRGEYQGRVAVNGQSTQDVPVSKMAKQIGLVFQDFEAQLFSTNTKMEIAFGPENFNVPKNEIEQRIHKVLETVDLLEFQNRQPATLSGGQKQRLAIGSVLASHPDILCLDEPTTDLDPIGKLGIFSLAKRLHQNSELTLVIIEHETEEALHADRLIFMKKGEIIEDGHPKDLLKQIDKTDALGIMPLQMVAFFSQFKTLKRDALPLNPDEGLTTFKQLNLSIDEEKHRKLIELDHQRENNYGKTIIDIQNLKHIYPNGTMALNNVNLTIRENEFIAILGHNGSGKTTLAKHINGLLTATEGDIWVSGKNTKDVSIFEIGRDVGYVFQNPDHQIFAHTVFDEVAFSLKIRGCKENEIETRVKEAIHAVDMDGYEKEDPFSLTKGKRQRVAVASILSARPKVIIMDEPTTGLDYTEQKKTMALIQRLNQSGHTIIMITHTMWVVSEYAHRVAVFKNGEIILNGRTRDVFANEEALSQSSLKAPHIVSLSNQLGKTTLSVDELSYCVKEEA